MGWSPNRFIATFARHGLTSQIVFGALSVPGGFVRPDAELFDSGLQAPDPEIEFETAALPDICAGSLVTVDGVAYRLREHPKAKGDGFYSIAPLQKA